MRLLASAGSGTRGVLTRCPRTPRVRYRSTPTRGPGVVQGLIEVQAALRRHEVIAYKRAKDIVWASPHRDFVIRGIHPYVPGSRARDCDPDATLAIAGGGAVRIRGVRGGLWPRII